MSLQEHQLYCVTINPNNTYKLLKLVIPKLNGDVTRLRSFWDNYDSAVNKNPFLSAVEKFN